MSTHFVNYRIIAQTTLDSAYTHPCTMTMTSTNSADPSTYNNKEWLSSPWTPDGKTVYALVHNEYQGSRSRAGATTSTRAGTTRSRAPSPRTRARRSPTPLPRPPRGVDSVPVHEGRAARLLHAEQHRALGRRLVLRDVPRPAARALQQFGTCLMRTRDLSDPSRGAPGTAPTSRSSSPTPIWRRRSTRPTTSARRSTSTASGTITESLTYNTYLKKWMLVGNSDRRPAHSKPPGVYYALSDDLLNWTDVELLMEAEITWARDCVLPDPIKEVSILDPASKSRNFETVGQTRPALLHLVPHERLQRHAGPRHRAHPDPVQPSARMTSRPREQTGRAAIASVAL